MQTELAAGINLPGQLFRSIDYRDDRFSSGVAFPDFSLNASNFSISEHSLAARMLVVAAWKKQYFRYSLLEGELGLVGLFGDGSGEGLFLDGTAEEENNFFEHGEISLIFVSVYSILHASGQFVSTLDPELKKS